MKTERGLKINLKSEKKKWFFVNEKDENTSSTTKEYR